MRGGPRPGAGRPRIDLDVDRIVKLYQHHKLQLKDVATRFGVHPDTVRDRLRGAGASRC